MDNTKKEFLAFINKCKSHYHVIEQCISVLEKHGFKKLSENEQWVLKDQEKYYVIRNQSSIISFIYQAAGKGVQLVASHSDAPCFRLKPNPIKEKSNCAMLQVEGYGGMICSTWLDTNLSIAGRLLLKNDNTFTSKLIDVDFDSCLIPNVAIHLNTDINNGYKYNIQEDMNAICAKRKEESFNTFLGRICDIDASSIVDGDLYLYNRNKAKLWGSDEEYISGQRLDDVACVYASLMGFVNAEANNANFIPVFACFDNEEVGSLSYQGARSTFLKDVFERIQKATKIDNFLQFCANSFMISADNAHATHPNHPEKNDDNHPVYCNSGIVIKTNAAMHYTSDAYSCSALIGLCEKSHVPYQRYVNRSDIKGGGTLGNLIMANVSMSGVDIGVAQFAMHSAYETMGSLDLVYLVKLFEEFYTTWIKKVDSAFTLK